MSAPLRVGDRVKPSDIREDSIPAYKRMRGTIVDVSADGTSCRVRWGPGDTDSYPRPMSWVTRAED